MITSGPSGVTRCNHGDPPREIDCKIDTKIVGQGPDRGAADEFEIEIADSIDAVDARVWDAAVAAHGLPVFYAHAFLTAYERRRLTAIESAAHLVVRRRGAGPDATPAAVAPAYVQRLPDPIGLLTPAYPHAAGQTVLTGHVWHCYDTRVGGPTIDVPLVAAVMAALRQVARERGAQWFGLVNVRRDGPTATALAELGLPLRHIVDRFTADTAGLTSLDGFLARSARKRARGNLRRYQRIAAAHGVTTAVLAPADADVPAVAALCRRSAAKHGSHDYYPPGRFEQFVAELGDLARVVEIRQHGTLVAAAVCLVDDQRVHWWASGALPAADGNFSPYYLVLGEVIALTLALRRERFEGGRGNGEFKVRHGLVATPLVACLVRT